MEHPDDHIAATHTARAGLTRRAALKVGGGAIAALAFPGIASARLRLLSHLRRRTYRRLIGHSFGARGTRTKLKLIGVRDLNRRQARSDNAFTLVFRGPRGARLLRSQVPEFSHPALGRFKLLIQPGKPSSKGHHYVAVVNRPPWLRRRR